MKVPYVTQCLEKTTGPIIAASDYVKALPLSVANWIPRRFVALGTDGFGRSDGRPALRDFFEVDAAHIVVTTLATLAQEGVVEPDIVAKAMKERKIDPEKANPVVL